MASRKRSISNDADVSAMVYKEWDEASCAICMDHPHNAVLLICSSHSNGCRSYICDTSYRHSNCLDRYKKLKEETPDNVSAPTSESDHTGSVNPSTAISELTIATNETDAHTGFDLGETNMEKFEEMSDLKCPLCRGSVYGWKVVEESRKYLDMKSRSCSHESCSFIGNYRELRSHARRVHPTVRPADVDPSRQRAWRRLEDQREYNDIVTAIRSAMPGAVIYGDYVMENGDRVDNDRGGEGERGRLLSTLFLFQMLGSMDRGSDQRGPRPRVVPRHRRASGTVSNSRRRYLWGENLLGIQDEDNDDEVEAEDERDVNGVIDDVPRNPRSRRRLTHGRSDEDRH